MFISSVILFAFKNWKIASRYCFASGVSRPLRWQRYVPENNFACRKIFFKNVKFKQLNFVTDIFSFYNYHDFLSSYIRCFQFHITHRIKDETTGYDVIGTIMVKAKNLANTGSHCFSIRMNDLFCMLFVRDAFQIFTGEKKSDIIFDDVMLELCSLHIFWPYRDPNIDVHVSRSYELAHVSFNKLTLHR